MAEEKITKNKDFRKVLIGIIIFLILSIILTIALWPYIQKLSDPTYQDIIQKKINDLGFLGFIILLLLQILQIVIAIIPGEVVQLLAGAIYGTWGGVGLCLLGCVIASAIVFLISRKLGKRFLAFFFSEEKMDSWKWIHDSSKSEMIIFILFLIPATPKDMLTYIVGISDIKLKRFLVITTIARIPAMLSSTLMGSSVRQGNWISSIVLFAVFAIIGIVGIIFKDKIVGYLKTNSKVVQKIDSKEELIKEKITEKEKELKLKHKK